MKKNVLLKVMSIVLCTCLLSGCSGNKEQTGDAAKSTEDAAELENISSEAYEEFSNGYDPEVDTILDSVRDDIDEPSLAATVININGEDVEFSDSDLADLSKSRISPSKNDGEGKEYHRRSKIDTVTIHCSAGIPSVYAMGNLFANKKNQVSANYAIDADGSIGLMVEEKDRAWTSSNSANDNRAVTIVVASDASSPYAVTDEAYQALIELVTDVCQRNNIEKLVWSDDSETRIKHLDGANMTVHRDFARKACPGDYLYSRMGDIAAAVNTNLGVE